MITESTLAAIAGLVGVIALLFLAITRFKWHVFIALLVPILLLALVPGMDRRAFIDAFEQGFGRTIQSIAVVIVHSRSEPPTSLVAANIAGRGSRPSRSRSA